MSSYLCRIADQIERMHWLKIATGIDLPLPWSVVLTSSQERERVEIHDFMANLKNYLMLDSSPVDQ